ncbi:hypothetical protein KXV85_006069, partial [Aspergillus fumigatus]
AGAGQGRRRRHPQGCGRSEIRRKLSRPRPSDRSDPDRQRGIFDRPGRRHRQRRRYDPHRARDPVARVAFGENHLRRVREPVHRSCDHHRRRTVAGGIAEPAVDRIRRTVRWPRRRLWHPVQRAIPLRALQERQHGGSAGRSRAAFRGSAVAGGDGHRG